MLIRISANIIKRIRQTYCVQNQTRTQLETISKIDDLEKVQLEWINLAKQKNDNTFDQDDEINEQENKKETKANEDLQESESESDDDDEPKGGRKIPIVELVKGFIPRLLRPEPQE
ncbi:unnamed protein product (macronuclear) [Paramecium tetraurelia]|uniref:Uncharacterized protein n=1 Tax=Paramecium tetraurelia TaxID=5888 RepID=A0CAB0_PARTE|nr:uncharacterized protein GSPATT00036507001 [Paramecium tetraurelia]CAK67727.1 unnamed protein product [Paramecium tetraurelia]|eukprot:XP_001435124.1 hypothetical protein (macronuclear) [Paramecium tetraurelia strain d4-2]